MAVLLLRQICYTDPVLRVGMEHVDIVAQNSLGPLHAERAGALGISLCH